VTELLAKVKDVFRTKGKIPGILRLVFVVPVIDQRKEKDYAPGEEDDTASEAKGIIVGEAVQNKKDGTD